MFSRQQPTSPAGGSVRASRTTRECARRACCWCGRRGGARLSCASPSSWTAAWWPPTATGMTTLSCRRSSLRTPSFSRLHFPYSQILRCRGENNQTKLKCCLKWLYACLATISLSQYPRYFHLLLLYLPSTSTSIHLHPHHITG